MANYKRRISIWKNSSKKKDKLKLIKLKGYTIANLGILFQADQAQKSTNITSINSTLLAHRIDHNTVRFPNPTLLRAIVKACPVQSKNIAQAWRIIFLIVVVVELESL